MIRFCEAHYREIDKQWGIANQYPGEIVIVDNDRCEHLDCIRRVRMACPHCFAEVSPRELIRLKEKQR